MPHHATAAVDVKASAFEPGNRLLPVPDFGGSSRRGADL